MHCDGPAKSLAPQAVKDGLERIGTSVLFDFQDQNGLSEGRISAVPGIFPGQRFSKQHCKFPWTALRDPWV